MQAQSAPQRISVAVAVPASSRWRWPVPTPVPPLPESDEGGACISAADARQVMLDLAALLAEFSGESMDYFARAQACLATALSPSEMARLNHHMEQYEFEAAGKLLAEAIKKQETL